MWKAENARREGDFAAAMQYYARGIAERLTNLSYGADPGARMEEADFVVLERLSDLARLFGLTDEADGLLAISVNQIAAAGNRYWADLLRVKRIDLALGRERLRAAQSLLNEMRPSIGDVSRISFTSAGLREWERGRRWPNTDNHDRATIFALLYFVMGRLLAGLGQYGQSEQALGRGLEHAASEGAAGRLGEGVRGIAEQAITPLRLALVTTLLEKGELRRAAERLEQLEGQARDGESPAILTQTLELRGKLSLLTGEFGTALECFRQVFDLCERLGFVRASVAAALNLSHALIFLNRTLDARRLLQQEREHAQRLGDLASVARADWLLELAKSRARSLADGVPLAPTVTEQWGVAKASGHRPPAAESPAPDNERAEAGSARSFAGGVNPLDLPQAGDYLTFFEDRALGFHWLLARRDFGACAAYFAGLKEVFKSTDSALIKLRLRVLSGLLAYYQDDLAKAEEVLRAVQPELRSLQLLPELWQSQRVMGWCWFKLGREQNAREALARENARLIDAMGVTLTQENRAFFLLNKWTDEEEALAVRINQLSRAKAELSSAPWHRRFRMRRRLSAQLEELLRLVDRHRAVTARRAMSTPAYASAHSNDPHGRDALDAPPSSLWRRLRRSLRRRATISFLVLPDRVLFVSRGRLGLDFGVSPATRVEVRELVRQWHEIVARIARKSTRSLGRQPDEAATPPKESDASRTDLNEAARQVAERLSDLLHLPSALDQLPRRTRSLTLVPDDCLHGFPFAAVVHRGRYLIERYALSFAYSSEEQEEARPTGGRSALLVGASLPGGEWEGLGCVPDELNCLEDWANRRGLSALRLDDATQGCPAPRKEAVLAALPRSAVAHIACHGLFAPDQPERSGIVLRPARQPDVLSVQELSALDLTGLRHVTLSACWSADHFIVPGRWIISLPETLARAGAASVLGCLWVVHDRVGTAFMSKFYEHLDKHTRAEALRRTQLACLNGQLQVPDAPHTSLPIFWAGYQLYGRSADQRL